MRRQLAVLLLAVALALTAAAPRASAAVEKPRYAKGDYWTYATNLSVVLGLVLEGNTTVAVGDLGTISVQGEDVSAFEVSVEGSGGFGGSIPGFGNLSGTWSVTGSEHWETTSWRPVRSFLRLTADGVVPSDPFPISFTIQFVNETTRRVLSDAFPWPIAPGAAGEVRARWNVTQNVTVGFGGAPPESTETRLVAELSTEYRENGTTRITVPAGAFDAIRIEERGPGGGVRVHAYAARVGNDVLEEDLNETGGRIATSALKEFRYRAGEPPPPFPWLTVVVVALAVVAAVLGAALALRRRKREPVEVWMPPEKGSPPEGPRSP